MGETYARPTASFAERWAASLAISVVLVLFAVITVRQTYRVDRREAAARLQSTAVQRASQIKGWLQHQMNLALFIETSTSLAGRYQHWTQSGDAQVRDELIQRARDSAQALDGDDVLVVDAGGQILLRGSPTSPELSTETRTAVARAMSARHSTRTSFYRVADPNTPLRMDMVIPLLRTGVQPQAAIVVRVDLRRVLVPILASWNEAYRTGESVLWARSGDMVTNVSALRLGKPGEDVVEQNISTSSNVAARVARKDMAVNKVCMAKDYRDADVLAMAQVVAPDWWLITSVDAEEIDGATWRVALWIMLGSGLAITLTWLLNRLWLQRRALDGKRAQIAQQQDRLQTLALLEAIAESSSDAIYAQDLQGRYIFCNRAAGEFMGMPPSRIVGATNADIFGVESAAQVDETDAIARFERLPGSYQELMSATGASMQIWTSKGPLRDANGESVGMLGISRDISELRRTERALRDSEAHFRSVVSVMSEGILVFDRHGRLVSRNPAAERMLDFADPEQSGPGEPLTPWQPIHPDGTAMQDAQTSLGRALAGGPPERDVLQHLRHPSGRRMIFNVATATVSDQDTGELKSVVLSLVEVTDKIAMEAVLARHRDELENRVAERTVELRIANEALALSRDEADSANRAKSAFLANMSHEIRTPMNAIIGLTHLLAREARDAKLVDRLGKIGGAAQHLLGLIDDVLDLSKIEAGKLTLEEADFTTCDILGRAVEMVTTRAAAKGLEVKTALEGLPPRLRGDALRLSQILINLLANAVKFTDHGWIRVKGDVAAVSGKRVCLRFEVEDTGPGISQAQQERLFNAFEQAEKSISRQYGGTGLGLALSRQLARAMGGDAGVTSAPGSGSVFWFTAWLGLPNADSPVSTVAQTAPEMDENQYAETLDSLVADPAMSQAEALVRRRHRGRRVLVAEDNPVNREVAEELLGSVGLVVETANDGTVAVRMVKENHYDLVFMDMQMPLMDGLEAARAIREQVIRRVPIIAMTANAFPEDRQACLDAGMNDHVAKPVDPEVMFEMLLRWLPGESGDALGVAGHAPNTWQTRLAAVEGFDMTTAMRNVGGQSSVLERVVKRFVKTYAEGLAVLLDVTTPEPDGINAWRKCCHSVRSALETIGATEIARDLVRLEADLRASTRRIDFVDRARSIHERVKALAETLELALQG